MLTRISASLIPRRIGDLLSEPLPRAFAIGGAAVAFFALAGFIAAAPAHLGPGAVTPEPWKLPVWSRAETSADVTVLDRRNPWGQKSAAEMAAVPGQNGPTIAQKIVGVVTRRGQDLVVAIDAANKTLYLRVGDSLADGSKITAVEATSVTMESGGAQRTLHFFHQK